VILLTNIGSVHKLFYNYCPGESIIGTTHRHNNKLIRKIEIRITQWFMKNEVSNIAMLQAYHH
jgi:hypothetical protein